MPTPRKQQQNELAGDADALQMTLAILHHAAPDGSLQL